MKTAIILAAGMGSRFSEITKDIPKGFISIYGKSLIEMSIEKLLSNGYKKIVIVSGYKSEFYEKLSYSHEEIVIMNNYNYEITGSGNSLYLGLLATDDDVTVLESDILYDNRMLSLLDNIDRNAIIVSGRTNSGDEVYVNCCDGTVNISKDKISDDELVGITKLMKTDIKNILVPFFEKQRNHSIEYEQVYSVASLIHTMKFETIKTNLLWCEIDNIEHYYRAVNEIYPKLNIK